MTPSDRGYYAPNVSAWAGATPRITLGASAHRTMGSLQPKPRAKPRPNFAPTDS